MSWQKEILKKIGYALYIHVLPAVLSLSACYWSIQSITQNKMRQVRSYVENNLTRIIEEQERELGIKHFGTPKISFGSALIEPQGKYHPQNDEIYVGVSAVMVTPETGFANDITRRLFKKSVDVKEVLDHELGHFYLDKLSESLEEKGTKVLGDWSDRDEIRLVHEGVAEYFTMKMNDCKDREEKFLTIGTIYAAGFELVKPIIDVHGKRGIEYLILHPPTSGDAAYLQRYQERALRTLSSKSL